MGDGVDEPMFLVTVRDDLAEINRALDEAAATRDSERRGEKLHQALLACGRALDGFLRNGDLAATLAQAGVAILPYKDAVGQTIESVMLFEAFLEAERRLFRDLGLDSSTTDRLLAAMRLEADMANHDGPDPETLEARLRELRSEVGDALEHVREEEEHEKRVGVIRRVFLVTGGAFVVGANALVGAGTAPITGGLSVAGAAVSASVGSVIIDRGLR